MSWLRENALQLTAVILIAIAVSAFTYDYWGPLIVPPTIVPKKYTTGLTAKFKIYDTANYTLVTQYALAEFYAAGANPFTRIFTTKPTVIATYDATYHYWSAPLDAGSYVLLIKDTRSAGTAVYYAIKTTVTVPGTDSEDKEVWLAPSTINIDRRATLTDVTVASPCFPYNTTGTYLAVASMNTTLDAAQNQTGYWFIEYTFNVADTDEVTKEGRIYFSKITDFIIEKVIVDGVEVTPTEDMDAADDGITGYYVAYSEWEPGRHHVTAYVHSISEISTTTFTAKIIEYYECYRPVLRWWTEVTKGLTVTKA